jgi:hypothetical protein
MKFNKICLFLILVLLTACSVNKPLPLYYEDSDRVVRVAHDILSKNRPGIYSKGVEIVSVLLPRHGVKNNIVVSFEPINKGTPDEEISGDNITKVYSFKLIAVEFTILGKFVSINEYKSTETYRNKIKE